ncbi:hypothetical protein C5749_14790 [Sphingobacterium gobiense]|uniref:Uncharacterized protein n=2 Tax=Sphingobacterium gobiense TaxID=1382456 RepID=A0A2S9JNF9_9SPHI|nr:hypothetical protein C5749_14790 [Sphingobacterium gobiense]
MAQQNITRTYTNNYIDDSYKIGTNVELNILSGNLFKDFYGGKRRTDTYEIDNDRAFYKIYYEAFPKKIEGLLNIWVKRQYTGKTDIKDVLDRFYNIYLLDDNEADYIKETVNYQYPSGKISGGYFLSKNDNMITIVIEVSESRSVIPVRVFAYAEITMNKLSVTERVEFAKDFIRRSRVGAL